MTGWRRQWRTNYASTTWLRSRCTPDLVRTEGVLKAGDVFDLTNSESPQFLGRAVAALATDPQIMDKSGKVLVAAALALEYGYTDVDGKQPRPVTVEAA